MRILIIEDEYNLADVISERLKKESYIVDISTDGETGLNNLLTNVYDLAIVDVMLPKMNGFDIVKKIRQESDIQTKVIILTAKSELEDKLLGFSYGINDYVTKPFHMDELIARVNAQLMNSLNIKDEYIEFGDLKLKINDSVLFCTTTEDSINIICKEYLILEYLMTNPNQILSKDQIYDKVWGFDSESESNNLEAYLSFIRRKLKAIGSNVNIKAVRGMGYRIEEKNEEIKE